jgi:hypothetical protein
MNRIYNTNPSNKQVLDRFQNLLNLVYLESIPCKNGGYIIPDKTFSLIETELDFSVPNDRSIKAKEEKLKTRYRQRSTYRYWKELLDQSRIPNAEEAKEFLLSIYCKLDNARHYGSMTHSRYALETLNLSLDDSYGTKYCILEQYKYHEPPKKKPKAKAKVSNKKPKVKAKVANKKPKVKAKVANKKPKSIPESFSMLVPF